MQMIFSDEELISIIEEIFEGNSYDTTIEVPREYLETSGEEIDWRKRNGISAAIERGFLIRVVPGTQFIPFTVRINPNALQVVDRVVSIR